MLPIFVKDAVTNCGGSFFSGPLLNTDSLIIHSISINTRTLEKGDFFIATPGDRFDGHDFLIDALNKGAVGAMVDEATFSQKWGNPQSWLESSFPGSFLWVVNGARRGLGKLGAYHRKRFPNTPVIAVGGSNGKTSTKEFLRHTLSGLGQVAWSQASFNNDIGTPLTLLKLDSEHQAAIVEVGSNHPGEMKALLQLVQPTHAVVTSIGREHLEFFGDLKGVIEEEGETLLALENGASFWGPDHGEFWNDFAKRIPEGVQISVVTTVDSTKTAHNYPGAIDFTYWRTQVKSMDTSGVSFAVQAPHPFEAYSGHYKISCLGTHQITNATYAIAVAAYFGVERSTIQESLLHGKGAPMRMEITSIPGGIQLINDAYNANAESMIAALDTLKEIPSKGKKWAVLGEMLELGSCSRELHAEVGAHAARTGLAGLWVIGNHAASLAEAATANGLDNVEFVKEIHGLDQQIKDKLASGDTLLLKASRGARLERLAEKLVAGAR